MGSIEDVPSVWGYPRPSDIQQPKADDLFANAVFSRKERSPSQRTTRSTYDYIVIGSGCTALAFIDETLRLNPYAKILCVERGGLLLPTHFQNLAAPFKGLIGGASETYPWTLSRQTYESDVGYCHGYYPFFGGRSVFWSGWCPQPSIRSLRGFPASMRKAASRADFWPNARRVLNVFSTSEVDDDAFSGLQTLLSRRLALPLGSVDSLESSEPAMLAASKKPVKGKTSFSKFCAAESLLRLADAQRVKADMCEGTELDILLNCPVEKIELDGDGNATGVQTSRGLIDTASSDTKIILCAGAIPNTTIMYNSLPSISHTAGKRLTGHFISHLTCRLPLEKFMEADSNCSWAGENLQIAAQCMLGYSPSERQYQIQITAVHCPNSDEQLDELRRKCPDLSASAQPRQIRGSERYVLFLCAVIGEFAETNEQCWIRQDAAGADRTTNVELQYLCNQDDYDLWSYMEEATFEVIYTALAPSRGATSKTANRSDQQTSQDSLGELEFWARDTKTWTSHRPEANQMRIKGVVHEASSTFVGREEEGGSLDEEYRPHGVNNVFVTGAGLFPTAGAWNPTLPMCGFAQHLAQNLHERGNEASADTW